MFAQKTTAHKPTQQREQAQMFYACLNSLISYAADSSKFHLEARPAINSANPREQMAATQMLDLIWEHPSLVKEYLDANPDNLTQEKLSVIEPWQYALRDIFICLENDYRHITCINDDRIFEVVSLNTPIEELIGPMPALCILTLLPFQGRLVCDGRVVHLSNKMRLGAAPVLEKMLTQASEYPLVQDARGLIDYTQELPPTHNVISHFCNVLGYTPQKKT